MSASLCKDDCLWVTDFVSTGVLVCGCFSDVSSDGRLIVRARLRDVRFLRMAPRIFSCMLPVCRLWQTGEFFDALWWFRYRHRSQQ